MQTTHDYYAELAEAGRAELEAHASIPFGGYENGDAVLFALDVKEHGLEIAIRIRMDENVQDACRTMGCPVPRRYDYRVVAQRMQADFEFPELHAHDVAVWNEWADEQDADERELAEELAKRRNG